MSTRRSLLAYNSLINEISTIPNNEIWYTSTNGNIVVPSSTEEFGATIISNTYTNGKGIIRFDGDVLKIPTYAFSVNDTLYSIIIPNKVTVIERAFVECYSLFEITIGDGVITIEEGAFENCLNLIAFQGKHTTEDGRSLIIDNTLIAYAPASGSFYIIPEGVISLGYASFYGSFLYSISIPDSVIQIGDYAFVENFELQFVSGGDYVREIGIGAFSGCFALFDIKLPNSLTKIGNIAFNSCYSLTHITIPENVTAVGMGVFYDCTNLAKVYCKPVIPPLASYSLFNYDMYPILYVPYKSLDAYQSNVVWREFDIVGYDFENDTVIITFTVDDIEYQAEEGMTFYDWAMSDYYDDSCGLMIISAMGYNLRNGIIEVNISPGDAISIVNGTGLSITPDINTDTIIQPISYMSSSSGFPD